MARILEVTTVAGKLQNYETIELVYYPGGHGFQNLNPQKGRTSLEDLSSHACEAYCRTGLDNAIKVHPAIISSEPESRGKLVSPERLRLIYDALPIEEYGPILRVSPTDGQIWLPDYDPKRAMMPLDRMALDIEFGAELHLEFAGLNCILSTNPSEARYADYYGRDLRESRIFEPFPQPKKIASDESQN